MSMNKIAVVTGANRGIGFEASRQLALRNFTVIMACRDAKRGESAVDQLRSEGLDTRLQELDVTKAEEVFELQQRLAKDFGRCDALINNAGVYLDEKVKLKDLDLGILDTTLAVNLYGPLRICQAILPLMIPNQYGRIVNISSGYGSISRMGAAVGGYKISKAALNAMTRILAHEVNPNEIKINTMDPGWVRTDMGGPNANRSPLEATETLIWLATLDENGPTGGFF
ncbi:MAG: SDR family NAD(P)-dependent oxidoreductase, partial [Calditrichaeota bacterium]|nr:SDR family NAD(P)-dependent oxidoreductase [Calditrichota bacterium]